MQPRVGFIGQGYVGKNYADDFERRGFSVVRYAKEEPYRAGRDAVSACDIVFIAVPTPTAEGRFDDSVVREVLGLVGKGKIAVVKSTVLPGTTAKLQEEFPHLILLMSPEFLSEATAAEEAAHPFSNIVGIARESPEHRRAAAAVHAILPKAPFSLTCSATEAEIVKYAHNAGGYAQIVFFNLIYDLAAALGVSWEPIGKAIAADPLIPNRYANPVHKKGRGAGGHCFIKDFAAFTARYAEALPDDTTGQAVLRALEAKNLDLLVRSGKDLEMVESVYGKRRGREG